MQRDWSKLGPIRGAFEFDEETEPEMLGSLEPGIRRIVQTQIKRYGGRLGHMDSRIGEKSW